MRVCGTAQQKLKGYFFYSPHFYTSADHNYAEQARLYNQMKTQSPIGQKFTHTDQINIPSEREVLRKSFDKLVSAEEVKAKKIKDELEDERVKRLKAEKEAAVNRAEADGHKATLQATKDAGAERKQQQEEDRADERDRREKKHLLDMKASETESMRA